MQEFYQASGGELGARVEGEDEDDVVEIPTLERMLGMIPDSGISFFELTKALGIHNIGTTRLQAVADGVYANTTRKEDGKLYPFQPDEFPSDDDVKDALSRGVRMSLLDLYKVGGVRALGTAKCHEFSNGLIRRGVIVVEDDGSVRVSRDSGKKTSGKDVASRKTTTQDTPSRRLSLPTGSPFDNMPTIGTPVGQTGTSDPDKHGSAEHRPASIPRIAYMGTPVKHLEDFSRLPAEMIRVRAAVLAHVRQWKTNFPRPTDCTWLELESIERSSVIRHINAYLSTNGLIDKPETQAATIDHLNVDFQD
jgi:hypothetical protein